MNRNSPRAGNASGTNSMSLDDIRRALIAAAPEVAGVAVGEQNAPMLALVGRRTEVPPVQAVDRPGR